MRKGLIPIVGAAREPGTSMLIEDVACPTDKLADMMIDLIEMFQRHGYNDASCFGHALEGNLHLVFSQVSTTDTGRRTVLRCNLACCMLRGLRYMFGGLLHRERAKLGSDATLLTCAALEIH